MSRKFINSVLLVVLVVLVAIMFFIRRDFTTRNIEILPGMVPYVAFNSQSSNPNFSDGKTLQLPVKGTVVRGFEPLPYTAMPEDAIRAGQDLVTSLNPTDSTKDIERGAFVYSNICRPCHGAGGTGDGIIAQHGFPPPPSLLTENARKINDGQIFHIISYGQRNMPSFATQVVRNDRWRVVKYIRSLQKKSQHAVITKK